MAVKIIEGKPEGAKFKIAIVISRFNDLISQRLLRGALAILESCGVLENHIEVAWVPVAWEIPIIALKMAETEKFDGIITLGAVIQGETSHHEYIANEVAAALGRLTDKFGLPVAFGLLTTASLDQALARAGETSDNKGAEDAMHLLESLTVLHQIH